MMEEKPENRDLKMEVAENVEQKNYCEGKVKIFNLIKKSDQDKYVEEEDHIDNQDRPEKQQEQNHSEINNDDEQQGETDTLDEDSLNIKKGKSISKYKIRKAKKKALMLKTTACLELDETLKAVTRKRRNDMTLKDKVQAIEMMEEKTKLSQGKIASHFNISQSQVSRIQKNRDAILEKWCKVKNPGRKRSRIGNAGNVEYKLLDWYEQLKKEEEWPAISGPILMEKARVIAQEEGIDFKPTDGWLGRWKERNGITFKRFKDKDGILSVRKLGNHWKRYSFLKATKDTAPYDVWVMDEVSFVYNVPPDNLNSKHYTHPEKLIAIMAFNLTGTERCDPMLIGSSQYICSFPLPLTYLHSPEVKITKEHFAQWLRNWDRSLRAQKRKIILLMNTSAHHHDNLHLFNISIIFFPPGTEPVLQPFQFGITEAFISLYRYQFVKHLLAISRTQIYNPHTMQVSILDAVYMISRAWKHLSPDTLIKGVVKTGLSKEVQSLNTSDQLAPPPGITQEDFDKFAKFNESNTENSEDLTVYPRPAVLMFTSERNIQKKQDPITSNEHPSDGNVLNESLPSVSEALQACQVIRKYLQKKGGHIHNEFSIVESAIESDMITDGRSDLSKEIAPDQLYDPRSVHSLISQKERIERIIRKQHKLQELSHSTDIKRIISVTNQPSMSSLESLSTPIVENQVNVNNQQGQEMHLHFQRHHGVNTIYPTEREEQHHHRNEASRVEFNSELKTVTPIRYPVISQHSSKIQVRTESKYQGHANIISDNVNMPTYVRSTVLTDGRSADIHTTESISEAPSHHTAPCLPHGSECKGVEVAQLTGSSVPVMGQTSVDPHHRPISIQQCYLPVPNHYDTHYMQTK